MRFGFHRFARCRNAMFSPFCENFNRLLDQRMLTGFRGFSSVITQGSEYHRGGFALGQTASSSLSTMIQEALCQNTEDDVLQVVLAEETLLESQLDQKGWCIACTTVRHRCTCCSRDI
eukprot:GEMP01108915.1.p1 GENE.GEMP01108915.1~~GEMP01108915.1.p1  ORF type:complete len:118 (+),score=13.16 GEMP01108915.1:54-407(+)